MSRMTRISLILTGLVGLSAASIAVAQAATSALKGHNGNAPVDVTADRLEAQDRADRAIFSGNVKVRQAEMTLDTQRLTVAYTSAGGMQIRRLDASGGVVVRSATETGRGNFGVYDLDRKLITLIGAVRLERQGSTINGQRLTIDLTSGRAVVDGGAPGIGQSGGRVTGHFLVPKKSQ